MDPKELDQRLERLRADFLRYCLEEGVLHAPKDEEECTRTIGAIRRQRIRRERKGLGHIRSLEIEQAGHHFELAKFARHREDLESAERHVKEAESLFGDEEHEAGTTGRTDDTHLHLFRAATQYYIGGRYAVF